MRLVDVDAGAAAPRAVEKLRREGVEIVLGTYGSTISGPAAVAARKAGMVLWETGAVGQRSEGSGAGESFSRLAPEGANLGRAGVAFVRDQLTPLLGGPGRSGTRSPTSTTSTAEPSGSGPSTR